MARRTRYPSGFARWADPSGRSPYRKTPRNPPHHFDHTFTTTHFLMHRTLVKWLFATYLLASGTVWSILILPLFPFAGPPGPSFPPNHLSPPMSKMIRPSPPQ